MVEQGIFKRCFAVSADVAVGVVLFRQKQEMQRAIQEFDAKIRRMEVLTGQRATDYDKLLGHADSAHELIGPPKPEMPATNLPPKH